MSSKIVGFDTETAVTFPRNTINKHHIGLIQIAIDTDVILWRLQKRRQYIWKDFPQPLRELLANSKIIKVGNGTYDDLKDLYEYYDINVSNMVDNQTIAKHIGYNKIGLVPLAAQLFGWRISKSEQISNWEASKLSKSQIAYASTDAWASLMIYYELTKMAELLQKDDQNKGTSSFHHILRQEAKFDTDFLSSLDFFKERFHTQKENLFYDSLLKRRKQRLSFDGRDYEVNKIQSLLQKQYQSYINPDIVQSPFIYKVGNSYAVT